TAKYRPVRPVLGQFDVAAGGGGAVEGVDDAHVAQAFLAGDARRLAVAHAGGEVVHLGGELIDVGERERLAVAAEALDAVVVERGLEAEVAAVGGDVDAADVRRVGADARRDHAAG